MNDSCKISALKHYVNRIYTLHLFIERTPDDFVECSFPGYKPITIHPIDWEVNELLLEATCQECFFTRTKTGDSQRVKGQYMKDHDGVVIGFEDFEPKNDDDFIMFRKGDKIGIKPKLKV